MAVSKKFVGATKWKIAIIGLKWKDALKRLSTQIEIDSQAATSRTRSKLERGDSGALRNVATCRAILHNRVAKASRGLPVTTDAVAGFDEKIAVVGAEQTE